MLIILKKHEHITHEAKQHKKTKKRKKQNTKKYKFLGALVLK